MEAFYFLLGVVVVLTVANVIGALIAFSKIKQLDNINNHFNNEIRDVHERISDVDEDIQRQLDSRLDKLEAKLTSKKLIKG